MQDEKEYIAGKMKTLISEGYSRPQSYMLAKSSYQKMQQGGKVYAQEQGYPQIVARNNQSDIFNPLQNPIPQYGQQQAPQPFMFGVDKPQPAADFYETLPPIYVNGNKQSSGSMPEGGVNSTAQDTLSRINAEAEEGEIGSQTQDLINFRKTLPDATPKTGVISDTYNKDIGGGAPTNFGKQPQYNYNYNLMNPYAGVSLEGALNFTGNAFGEGNVGMGVAGAGLSALKGARNFLTGFASGKENKRVRGEYMDERFGQNPNYVYASQQGGEIYQQGGTTPFKKYLKKYPDTSSSTDTITPMFGSFDADIRFKEGQRENLNKAYKNTYSNYLEDWERFPENEVRVRRNGFSVVEEYAKKNNLSIEEADNILNPIKQQGGEIYQQGGKYYAEGGKITNAEFLTGQFLADEGQGNVNLENGEYVKRSGNIQEVVGDDHIVNGEVGNGVNGHLNPGDSVLSNYTKIPAKDIKELKGRYQISLKKGATFADAMKSFNKKIGIEKLTKELADDAEKFGKNNAVKDETAKRLNEMSIAKNMESKKAKLEALKDPQSMVYEDLFARQEALPKLGNGKQLFDKNGKVVEGSEIDVAQEGGEYLEIAKKYGISPERAQQLIQMQQGGEMPQEEQQMQEQGAPQGQEEQMQQLFEAVSQMLQQGMPPEQIAEQLAQMGIPQEAIAQIIEQVASQMQGGQEQVPQGQEEQQMVAQQGGKVYAQESIPEYAPITIPQGISKLGVTPIPDEVWNAGSEEAAKWFLRNAETFANTEDSYKPKFEALKEELKNTKTDSERFKVLEQAQAERQQVFANKYPDLAKYVGGKYSGTQLGLQKLHETLKSNPAELKKFENALKESGITITNGKIKEGSYRVNALGDKTPLKTYLTDIKSRLPEAYNEYSVGNITEGKWDRRLENFRTVDFENEAQKEEYVKKYGLDKVGDFWVDPKNPNNIISPKIKGVPATTPTKPADTTVYPPTEGDPAIIEDRNKNVMPWLPQKMFLPPSPLDPIAKEEIYLPRQEPIKMTEEPMLAEQARQSRTDIARVEGMGLSPQQQEAMLAGNLASNQIAANDAIGKVSMGNADIQFKTDQFNLGQRGKEMITNANLRQGYQDKVLAGMANYERDYRNFLNDVYLDSASKFKYIDDMNLVNAENENYDMIPGRGVIFNDRKSTDASTPELDRQVGLLSAAQRKVFEEEAAKTGYGLTNLQRALIKARATA